MSENVADRRVAFVTGGSGFVGGRLIRALVASGWEVRALARSQEAQVAVKALASPVQGDLNDRAALQKGMIGSARSFFMWPRTSSFGGLGKPLRRSTSPASVFVVDTAAATQSVRKVVAVSAAAVVMGDPEPIVAAKRERVAPRSCIRTL